MNKAVAVLTILMLASIRPAVAQSLQVEQSVAPNEPLRSSQVRPSQSRIQMQPVAPSVEGFGDAASLSGLQTRSLRDTSLPSPASFSLPGVGQSPQYRGPLGSLEIGGGGLDLRANPSNVFPQTPAEYNTGMKVRYRFDPQD
ncbi:MAG: hypothetical protein KME13_01630 [Myxacorys californica WJT36-NPBG1]|jgi:hypothetical protein|nr:hypothetical protein [Myxacorys californica WJT36-NPBG1]